MRKRQCTPHRHRCPLPHDVELFRRPGPIPPILIFGIGHVVQPVFRSAGWPGLALIFDPRIQLVTVEPLERAIATFAGEANGGLVVTATPFGVNHPDLVAALAAKYKLPAVYPFRYFTSAGGLISYGPDLVGQSGPAAAYVARILKGEKPADLPVQAPTKYELVINLKTAKALGLMISPTLLARADDVID